MPKRLEWTIPIKCEASITILLDEDEGPPDAATMLEAITREFDRTGGIEGWNGATFYACALEAAGAPRVTHEKESV